MPRMRFTEKHGTPSGQPLAPTSNRRSHKQILTAFLVFASCGGMFLARAQQTNASSFPYPSKLDYHIEWRLITAGVAHLDLSRVSGNTWETKLSLESAGLVTRLYRVDDKYRALADNQFCAATSSLDAQEGKRHRFTTLNFSTARRKVDYQEKDLVANKTTNKELDIAPCTHEIAGALAALRMARLEPGKSTTLPLTDGKKMAMVKVDAQEREQVSIGKTNYQTIRYEAFVFDNVLYQRKARLWIWLTDDAARVPVQIRIRLAFPIGNITLILDKEEH